MWERPHGSPLTPKALHILFYICFLGLFSATAMISRLIWFFLPTFIILLHQVSETQKVHLSTMACLYSMRFREVCFLFAHFGFVWPLILRSLTIKPPFIRFMAHNMSDINPCPWHVHAKQVYGHGCLPWMLVLPGSHVLGGPIIHLAFLNCLMQILAGLNKRECIYSHLFGVWTRYFTNVPLNYLLQCLDLELSCM